MLAKSSRIGVVVQHCLLISCLQAGETRQRQVGILLNFLLHRTDKDFKSFLSALVEEGLDEFATALDTDIAEQFIHQRDECSAEGMIPCCGY